MPETVPVPPPAIVHNPVAVDAWYAGLSPAQRGQYLNHLRSLIEAMGPRRRRLMKRVMERLTGSVVPGLGAWGALVGGLTSSLLQVGSSVYMQQEQAELQEDLASESADLQRDLAKIKLQAQAEAEQAMINAQTDAAREAARAQVEAAKIAAQRDVMVGQQRAELWSSATPYVAGVAGVAILGGVFLYLKKRKKKRSR